MSGWRRRGRGDERLPVLPFIGAGEGCNGEGEWVVVAAVARRRAAVVAFVRARRGEEMGARAVGVVEVDAHACGGRGRLEAELPRATENGGGGGRVRKKVGEKMTRERQIYIRRCGGSGVAWALDGRLIQIRR